MMMSTARLVLNEILSFDEAVNWLCEKCNARIDCLTVDKKPCVENLRNEMQRLIEHGYHPL